MKTVFKLLTILVALSFLVGCNRTTYDSKADYFDGSVLVGYHQTLSGNSDDTVTFTFNQKGSYDVKFSYTEGYENSSYNQGKRTLPKDFTIEVTDGPKNKVISQYVLPGFLTITITHGDVTESHDFK